MTYNAGTATDYIDLLDQLVEVLTSRHLDTIAINAAGTGYVAGEILGLDETGATSTHVAQIEVLTVGGSGEITSARIYRGGAYTVDPTTTTGNGATGGSGSSATFDLTFAETGWTLNRRTKVAASATVGSGGTGYSVSDTLTVVGGVLGEGGSAATFNVDSVSSGVVTAVSLVSAGQYEVPPTNPALTSGGGGSGCTLNVTYSDKSGDTVVLLTGDAGGSNIDPIVAIKTYQGLDESGINTTRNWAIFSATSSSTAVPVHELPNVSPGFNTSANDGTVTTSTTGDGAFFPLKAADAFDIEWWIRATGRSFVIVAKVIGASTTYYPAAGGGLFNPFGITTELPFPAFVFGASDRVKVWYRDTTALFGGLGEFISRVNGPGFFWAPEGEWVQFRNAIISSNTSLAPSYTTPASSSPRTGVWPLSALQAHQTAEDANWVTAPLAGFDNEDLTLATPVQIYRTPNTGGDLFPLFAQTVIQSDGVAEIYRTVGEIDGVSWFSVGGVAISSEDRFDQGGEKFTIFQSGTRVEVWSFACLRED